MGTTKPPHTQPPHSKRGSIVIESLVWVGFLAVAAAAVLAIYWFFVREETQKVDVSLSNPAGAVYRPDCFAAEGWGAGVAAGVIGGPLMSEELSTSLNQISGINIAGANAGSLWRLNSPLSERKWDADFNGDGDTDDIIFTETDRIPQFVLGRDTDGFEVANPGDSPGGLRVVDPDQLGSFIGQRDRPEAVVYNVQATSGSDRAHDRTINPQALDFERANILVHQLGGCWGIQLAGITGQAQALTVVTSTTQPPNTPTSTTSATTPPTTTSTTSTTSTTTTSTTTTTTIPEPDTPTSQMSQSPSERADSLPPSISMASYDNSCAVSDTFGIIIGGITNREDSMTMRIATRETTWNADLDGDGDATSSWLNDLAVPEVDTPWAMGDGTIVRNAWVVRHPTQGCWRAVQFPTPSELPLVSEQITWGTTGEGYFQRAALMPLNAPVATYDINCPVSLDSTQAIATSPALSVDWGYVNVGIGYIREPEWNVGDVTSYHNLLSGLPPSDEWNSGWAVRHATQGCWKILITDPPQTVPTTTTTTTIPPLTPVCRSVATADAVGCLMDEDPASTSTIRTFVWEEPTEWADCTGTTCDYRITRERYSTVGFSGVLAAPQTVTPEAWVAGFQHNTENSANIWNVDRNYTASSYGPESVGRHTEEATFMSVTVVPRRRPTVTSSWVTGDEVVASSVMVCPTSSPNRVTTIDATPLREGTADAAWAQRLYDACRG